MMHGVKIEIKAQGEAIGLQNDQEMVELLAKLGPL